MNIASYRALSDGLQAMGEALQRQRMMKRDKEQRAFDNTMRTAMFALQKQQAAQSVASAERDFNYRKDRDAVGDQRFGEETAYRRGRDTVADARDTRDFTYRQGRDTLGDQRYDTQLGRQMGRDQAEDAFRGMELSLRREAARNRGSVGGYVTEELDDEGNVISTRRRTPLSMGDLPVHQAGGAGGGGGGARPMTQADVLNAVRSGKMTKEEGRAYGARMGWN